MRGAKELLCAVKTCAATGEAALTREVLREVFSRLGPWQWATLASVCRSWRAVARDDEQLWRAWAAAHLPLLALRGGDGAAHPRVQFVSALAGVRDARSALLLRLCKRGRMMIRRDDDDDDDDMEFGLRLGRSGAVRFAKAPACRGEPWALGMHEVLHPEDAPPQLGFMFSILECGGPMSFSGMTYSRSLTLVGYARAVGKGGALQLAVKWASETSYGCEQARWELDTSQIAREAVLRVDATQPRRLAGLIRLGGVNIELC
eukprot:m51a1_g4061 hypothetical protein (261) ;mRNA; f:733615-734690